jgi:hypothetical protein
VIAAYRGSRVLNPELTEPDVVPMTVERHDHAVAALATMVCDWLQTRAATAPPKPRRAQPAAALSPEVSTPPGPSKFIHVGEFPM